MSDSLTPFQTASAVTNSILTPVRIISISSFFAIKTATQLLLTRDFHTLFSRSRFIQLWFANFWRFFGPLSAEGDKVIVSALAGKAYGNVLDLGPGSGLQLKHFNGDQLHKVYGIEPCTDLHRMLREAVEANGLAGKYEVLACGAEELEEQGLEKGSFDTVLCCKVLCGVPEPAQVLKTLYGYLKPGGQLLVYEHVLNEENSLIRGWQRCLQWVWPVLLQGCNLDRCTEKLVREAGEWETVELGKPEGQLEWEAIPFVLGRAVKK